MAAEAALKAVVFVGLLTGFRSYFAATGECAAAGRGLVKTTAGRPRAYVLLPTTLMLRCLYISNNLLVNSRVRRSLFGARLAGK